MRLNSKKKSEIANAQHRTLNIQLEMKSIPSNNPSFEGPFREIEYRGRSGFQALSIHSRILIGNHCLGRDRGSATLWVLALEFEFLIKKEFGLGFLCLQATGMQQEDFMKNYPLRKPGSMSMMARENIRNYHWEWFSEMEDTYNLVNTHAVCKEPWMKPLAYDCHDRRLAKNEWHTLRFVQEGNHLLGGIDGQIVREAEDQPNQNHGPVYTSGHIGLLCILGAHLVYRNLKEWNKTLPDRMTQTIAG